MKADDLETCWVVFLGLYCTHDTGIEVDSLTTDFKECLAELSLSNATVVCLYVTADGTAVNVSVRDYVRQDDCMQNPWRGKPPAQIEAWKAFRRIDRARKRPET